MRIADDLTGTFVKVLDHGSVEIIDYMGDFHTIAAAARVSYNNDKKPGDDIRLVKRLYNDNHGSPFEMCEIHFCIKAPLFVIQQWLRHRTANVNQVSHRYTKPEFDFYTPEKFRSQTKSNKQKSIEPIDETFNMHCRHVLDNHYEDCFHTYEYLIKHGVAREQARIVLPTGLYSKFRWKIDLRNLLNFLYLRLGEGAQNEIQEYARVISELVFKWMPELRDIVLPFKKI